MLIRGGTILKYGFIGVGNMASAIIKGMVHNGFQANSIFGVNRSQTKLELLNKEVGLIACPSIEALMQEVDVVVLSVKPQMFEEVLPTVRQHLREGQIIISIAAGKSLDYLHNVLGNNISLFRVMPNMNATIGASTSCYSTRNGSFEMKQIVENMFKTVGSIVELPEQYYSIFTAVACSSPAFTYMYVDALARAAVKAGMPKQLALEIAASSVMGSAQMVTESGTHPWQLIDQVCSPGGTTIEGVTSLQQFGFEHAVHMAVQAVIEKDLKL